ncbi:Elongator complex protein 2 [Plasmodiophora brassicae]|uniref:Elongator complex protein 2 n=1 Tax=Plasmodiophora brassicae TaxID=37360 RepID=A0A0G4J3Q4_PLABS|nr:hypothetical protein PBRA_002289 [Plasmodiophora brassicae]SPQ98877.1 unnamed protein product [Plasmodiophora brassicae]
MAAEALFIAGGCNRSSSALSWRYSVDDLIAYCCGSVIAISDAKQCRIRATLVGHDADSQTTAVRWVPGSSKLVSGASDGLIIVWAYSNAEYQILHRLEGHVSSVASLTVTPQYIVSTSSDGTVRIWGIDCDQPTCIQVVTCASLPLCTAITAWQGTTILAVGDVSSRVTLYRQEQECGFVSFTALAGHADWVRDLDFWTSDSGCVLASASQDGNIRLWRVSFDECLPDAVLEGHDDAVLSCRWSPDGQSLLSASMDKSMAIWREHCGAWLPLTATGEVGGHTLACYSADWSPNGDMFIGHTYNGGFYLFSTSTMQALPVWTGHAGPVAGLTWHPDGDYLLTVGESDQTTRAFARRAGSATFCEIGRPQVHGYDMSCIATINSVPYRFASGAHEKIIRVFDAPSTFLRDLHRIAGVAIKDDGRERAECVFVPEVGLSNKAEGDGRQRPIATSPPLESTLMQDTLWPEVAKLYGHGNDTIVSICTSHDGTLLASSCAAKEPADAAVIVWDTTSWCQVGKIAAHALTVVAMEFSHDSRFLLTASRDRSVALSARQDDGQWCVVQTAAKAHQRIIWSCGWTHDDALFATGSRDKRVNLFSVSPDASFKLAATSSLGHSVRAMAWQPGTSDRLAVGLDNGRVIILQAHRHPQTRLERLFDLDPALTHSGPIRGIAWRPADDDTRESLLATCGDDHTVRIFRLS